MKHLVSHELDLSAALPAPDGRSMPCFFGRRFLTARELIATGLVRNHVTLRRLIAEGRLPAPLLVGRKLRVWDTLELQALIDRLADERGGKGPAASGAAGKTGDDAEPEELKKRLVGRPTHESKEALHATHDIYNK